MEIPVIETRHVKISNVVITSDDIRALATIVDNASKEKINDKSYYSYSFGAKAFDDSEYESTSCDVFRKGGVLETKRIQEVNIYFSEHSTNSRMNIRITHGDSRSMSNEITVSGTDSTWVNGVMRQFEDIINNLEKQKTWPKQFYWVIVIILALGIGRIISFLLFDVIFVHSIRREPATPFIGWIVVFLFIFLPASLLSDKIVKLWPSIEIRAGKDYAQIEKRKRYRLWILMSLGIIPILISIITEIIKLVLK